MINERYLIRKRQTGSALIIGLTILMVILILGTAGMRTNIMEERMAGNVRDYSIAFQAAESGLIDGELDVRNVDPVTNEPLVHSSKPWRNTSSPNDDDFSANCIHSSVEGLNGFCLPSTTSQPQWLAIDWNATTNIPYREYGQDTEINSAPPPALPSSPPALPSVSEQPRYIIEYLGTGPGSLAIGGAPRPVSKYYRVTTQGYGTATTDNSEPLARVMLQSIYGK